MQPPNVAESDGLTDEQAQAVHDGLSDALGVPREPLAVTNAEHLQEAKDRVARIAVATTLQQREKRAALYRMIRKMVRRG